MCPRERYINISAVCLTNRWLYTVAKYFLKNKRGDITLESLLALDYQCLHLVYMIPLCVCMCVCVCITYL